MLILLEQYPLDIVYAQGGFISTDWIIERESPNQRCLIKIHVISRDLITTGVNTNFICSW